MLEASDVNQKARALGAELVGISPVERFDGAPEGFRPTDVYPDCRSVLVFARRFPSALAFAGNSASYTCHMHSSLGENDVLALNLARWLEERGVDALPIPSDDPYEHWEPERSYGRAILSLKHAAQFAGLGVLGKNTLLTNDRFGNLLQLGAVLIAAELEPDPLASYQPCLPTCRVCLQACPAKALDGTTCRQDLCRPVCLGQSKRGHSMYRCNLCRRICPNARGIARRGA